MGFGDGRGDGRSGQAQEEGDAERHRLRAARAHMPPTDAPARVSAPERGSGVPACLQLTLRLAFCPRSRLWRTRIPRIAPAPAAIRGMRDNQKAPKAVSG